MTYYQLRLAMRTAWSDSEGWKKPCIVLPGPKKTSLDPQRYSMRNSPTCATFRFRIPIQEVIFQVQVYRSLGFLMVNDDRRSTWVFHSLYLLRYVTQARSRCNCLIERALTHHGRNSQNFARLWTETSAGLKCCVRSIS
jgi:hypothetical protein